MSHMGHAMLLSRKCLVPNAFAHSLRSLALSLPSHPCSLRTVTKVKSFLDTFVEWVAKSKKATEDKQVFGDWAASLAIPVPADKPAAGSGAPGMAWPDFASLGNATAQLVDSAKTLVSLCRRLHARCII